MATKIITVEATPPAESSGADVNKGAPLNAAEFDQNLINLRAAIDRRATLASPTFSGTVALPADTAIGSVSAAEILKLDGLTATTAELNKLAGTPAGLTSTELGYVDGVTSAIQTQLNTKAPLASPTFSGTLTLPGGCQVKVYSFVDPEWGTLTQTEIQQQVKLKAGLTSDESITIEGTTVSGISARLAHAIIASYSHATDAISIGGSLENVGSLPSNRILIDADEVLSVKGNYGILLDSPGTDINGLVRIFNPGQPIIISNAPNYASNAAAVSAGLGVGAVYRNGDNLCIVH